MGRPDYDPNPISPNPDPLTPGRVGSGLAGRDPSATPSYDHSPFSAGILVLISGWNPYTYEVIPCTEA